LKNSGRADVILATSNSNRARGDTLKGLRLDGRLILMGISDEPLTVTGHLLMNRGCIIGSIQNDREYLYEALDYVAKGKWRSKV
jgi:dehydrogenase